MKRSNFFAMIGICMLVLPMSVCARGNKENNSVLLTIENMTNARITEIVITEIDTRNTQNIVRNLENDSSTEITLKKRVLYGIVLIDTNERQYAIGRQAWEEDTAVIRFQRRDIVDRNIWDRVRRVIFWPDYL